MGSERSSSIVEAARSLLHRLEVVYAALDAERYRAAVAAVCTASDARRLGAELVVEVPIDPAHPLARDGGVFGGPDVSVSWLPTERLDRIELPLRERLPYLQR